MVATGASLQAALIQMEEGTSDIVERESFPLVEIEDVTSHSLGIIAIDEKSKDYNSIILKKNTTNPCKASEKYCTVVDNQTELRIQVTQGDDADPTAVRVIADQILKIPPYPRGAPIEVFFEYDLDGIIQVTVVDLTAGNNLGKITLERKANLNEENIQNMQDKMSTLNIN